MKYYTNIINAINYRTHCPLCKKRLRVNEEDLAESFFRSNNSSNLHFYIDQRHQDKCIINPVTNKVWLSVTEQLSHWNELNGGALVFSSQSNNYQLSDGKFIHALNIECQRCCHYGFTLQIHIDLKECKLIGVFLDSEALIYSTDGEDHEIRSSYATSTTEYIYYSKNDKLEVCVKNIKFPLLELDLENPLQAIARIKKLLVFS